MHEPSHESRSNCNFASFCTKVLKVYLRKRFVSKLDLHEFTIRAIFSQSNAWTERARVRPVPLCTYINVSLRTNKTFLKNIPNFKKVQINRLRRHLFFRSKSFSRQELCNIIYNASTSQPTNHVTRKHQTTVFLIRDLLVDDITRLLKKSKQNLWLTFFLRARIPAIRLQTHLLLEPLSELLRMCDHSFI